MTQYVITASEWLNFGGLVEWFRDLRAKAQHNRKIRETIKELSSLSDAELRDIGISRGDIWSIAHETYYDNLTPAERNKNLRGWV